MLSSAAISSISCAGVDVNTPTFLTFPESAAAIPAAFSGVFQRRLTELGRQIREINGRLTGNFNEGITGAMTVKTLGIEDRMDKRFFAESGEMRRAAVMSGHLRGLFLSMISFSGFTALALVLWQGGKLTEQGLADAAMMLDSCVSSYHDGNEWLAAALRKLEKHGA